MQNNLSEDIIALLASGEKVEAIKLLREQSGIGLKEAKEQVDRYLAGEPDLPDTDQGSADFPEAARLALLQGRKIDAIKQVRTALGLGLKEAKEFVEAYLKVNSAVRHRFDQINNEKMKASAKWVFLIVGVGLAVFFYLRSGS